MEVHEITPEMSLKMCYTTDRLPFLYIIYYRYGTPEITMLKYTSK